MLYISTYVNEKESKRRKEKMEKSSGKLWIPC